jgi:hypothetical protein
MPGAPFAGKGTCTPGPHLALLTAEADWRSANEGSPMDSAQSYNRLAFQCMKLTEAVATGDFDSTSSLCFMPIHSGPALTPFAE